MSEPLSTSVEVEVRYAETDQMGIVHHANYLVWFELARTRLCAASGTSYPEIERGGHLLVVTRAELDYRQSARYGDTVSVRCHLADMASRQLTFAYEVTRDGEVLVRGRTEHVWVDAASGRPCRIPEPLRGPFAALAGPAEA